MEMRNLPEDFHNRISELALNSEPSFKAGCGQRKDLPEEGTLENSIMPLHSPMTTSSSNSNYLFDPNSVSPEKTIGGLQISNLKSSPRKLGAISFENTDSLPNIATKGKSDEFQRFLLHSPTYFPRRAPGFPKRVISPPCKEQDNEPQDQPFTEPEPSSLLYEKRFPERRESHEEFYDPQIQQQLQQQKILEFQQRSKRKQVEQVLPLDDESGLPQSSASYIGQRLLALKNIQQKQLYEHLLQQQYENKNIIEEAYSNDPLNLPLDHLENEVDLDMNDDSHCPPKSLNYSPETYSIGSNYNDIDSDPIAVYRKNLDLQNEQGGQKIQLFDAKSMPSVEDGLSSENDSDSENNNLKLNSCIDLTASTTSGDASFENISRKAIFHTSSTREADTRGQIISRKISDTDLEPTNNQEKSKEVSDSLGCESSQGIEDEDNNNIYASKESLTSTNTENIPKTDEVDVDTDLETDRLLGEQRKLEGSFEVNQKFRKIRCANGQIINSPRNHISKTKTYIRKGVGMQPSDKIEAFQKRSNSPTDTTIPNNKVMCKGIDVIDPSHLIDGILFRARYLGTTQLVCEGRPTKSLRMMQAEEAVTRIKAPDGENQPSTEVDLFVSTEKIMVLNADMKEMMMDHALKTISYIADIGNLVVLMARRKIIQPDASNVPVGDKLSRTPKMICHVFESDEAQFIAQSIGQAFQVAYTEFLKANGIEDHSFMKEMDYQEVLSSQEIFGDELEIFAKKELQKEIVIPKAKGEILGIVIVESGWGSMLPTVVIANLASNGAAARCGQLNIGDQIIAINGLSLVGLPLLQCQTYIRNAKNQTAVKFTVVSCAPVVEVKIKRPDTKYQLGFSVQNGIICSLLRGGIAERGGVRVGHRIIEINNQSVVAVSHEKIVSLLATSVGEILMKTMPIAMFRLLTGQESPIYI